MRERLSVDSVILKELKAEPDRWVSGEFLSECLGLSRAAVCKRMKALKEAGYQIESQTNKGYRYIASPDKVIADELKIELQTSLLGREILSFDSIDSTNRLGVDLAQKGGIEGTLIFAETQTNGQGRLGRRWESPKSKGLYFSILLRPKVSLPSISKLTLVVAIASTEVLRELTDQAPFMIKWPNDIVIDGRKIAGILTQMDAELDRIHSVVIGIGLNIYKPKQPLSDISIALDEVADVRHSKTEIAARLIERIESYYTQFINGKLKNLASVWESYSAISGRRVSVTMLHDTIEGIARGIDDDGSLWVRQDSGIQRKINSGDVQLLR